MGNKKIIIVIKIIAILMLLVALSDNPYSYYQILKWAICGLTIFLAFLAYENHKIFWVWTFGVIAIFFNPIAPVYLDRGTWCAIDMIVASLILISIFNKKLNSA